MDKIIKVSVVIITYNHSKYIKTAIESVLNQKTDFEYEILLADDCSTDGTQSIVHNYENKIKCTFRRTNVGATKNLYELLCACKGEYITILEGDDFWISENRLQILSDFLDAHKEFLTVGHMREAYNEEGNDLHMLIGKQNFNITITEQELINTFCCMSSMFHNIFIDAYPEEYSIIYKLNRQQCDVTLERVLLQNGNAFIINECLGAYRISENKVNYNYNSLFSKKEKFKSIIDINRGWEKYIGKKNLYAEFDAIKGAEYIFDSIIKKDIISAMGFVIIMGFTRTKFAIRILSERVVRKVKNSWFLERRIR